MAIFLMGFFMGAGLVAIAVAIFLDSRRNSTSPPVEAKAARSAREVLLESLLQGTISTPLLKMAINEALVAFHDAGDQSGTLRITLGRESARELAGSSEVLAVLKSSYWVNQEIEEHLHPNGKFGLPSRIYGCKINIDVNCSPGVVRFE